METIREQSFNRPILSPDIDSIHVNFDNKIHSSIIMHASAGDKLPYGLFGNLNLDYVNSVRFSQ